MLHVFGKRNPRWYRRCLHSGYFMAETIGMALTGKLSVIMILSLQWATNLCVLKGTRTYAHSLIWIDQFWYRYLAHDVYFRRLLSQLDSTELLIRFKKGPSSSLLVVVKPIRKGFDAANENCPHMHQYETLASYFHYHWCMGWLL